MSGTGTHSGTHQSLDVRGSFLVGKEPDIPFHGHAHPDVQAVPLGGVEKPARRHCVSADRVQTVCCHQGEVLLDNLRAGILGAILTRAKCPISDAADVQLLVSDENEFPPGAGPEIAGRCGQDNCVSNGQLGGGIQALDASHGGEPSRGFFR